MIAPYWQSEDGLAVIHQGDVLAGIPLPDNFVHCVVTSPPYWGLRDYGVEGQLGLEKTPEEFVERMVAVFREVRRVMRPDATLWMNLGDTYCANVGTGFQPEGGRQRGTLGTKNPFTHPTKPKDLVGIPWRVAFALQAEGWYLRSDIIWSKPNPMPESVTDRPTKAHEYVFMLTKSARYYYDAEAVREEAEYGRRDSAGSMYAGIRRADHRDSRIGGSHAVSGADPSTGRNRRSVWTIPTEPTPEAHFATYPTKLVEPCVLAGTSAKGCCPQCGAPWKRVMEKRTPPSVANSEIDRYGTGEAGIHRKVGGQYQKWLDANPPKTTGWQPTCACGIEETIPCVVFDPFMGSGTTLRVARAHGRKGIGLELNRAYCDMAVSKMYDPLFDEEPPVKQEASTQIGLL